MGLITKLALVGVVVIVAIGYQKFNELTAPIPLPEIDLNAYWGPGSAAAYKEDTSIKPFKVEYNVSELLKILSQDWKINDPWNGAYAFEKGFNSKTLKDVVKYWRDNYLQRWPERLAYFNKFPHFTTQIQGLKIHFLHVKPTNVGTKKIVPLILLHGWPGSVREFYDFIPLLTTPSKDHDYVFEVIAPSLVGYGWSEGAAKRGHATTQMAVVFRNLMLRLGYKRFLVHGGDWGSVIGSGIATLFPENVIGYHTNMCAALTPLASIKLYISSLFPTIFYEEGQEKYYLPLGERLAFLIEESGYMHIQATKPDTIGIALSNNPIGLAAYILEKFSTWTNRNYRSLPDGGLEKKFKLDQLLDNIMVYYMTDSITTSVRLYAEHFGEAHRNLKIDRVQTNVPMGCARLRYELFCSTDWQLSEKFTNIVHSTYHPDGGHFAVFEIPVILYNDFVSFVKKLNI